MNQATTTQAERAARQVEWDAEKAEAADAPTGRTQVEGEVVATKWVDGRFPAFKMMVKADTGYRVWVTVPEAIEAVEKGDRVRFTANLTQSDDDSTFAFGKRPTQAEVLNRRLPLREGQECPDCTGFFDPGNYHDHRCTCTSRYEDYRPGFTEIYGEVK